MTLDKTWILGLLVLGLIAGGAWALKPMSFVSSDSSFLPPSTPTTSEITSSPFSIGYTDLSHNSIPTKMSLQGKVTDFNGNLVDDANLGVKISDANSCTTNVFYDYTFPNLIQDGFFNVLLGQNELLKLNFNQDYYMCLYVNTQLLSGPQVFRGGQGEVHSDALFDGNVTTPLDVNYLKVRNDLNVGGNLTMGCGKIYWNDTNQTLVIQVSC